MQFREIFRRFRLTEDELRQFEPCTHVESLSPGAVIMRRGDLADSFFCVLSGELAVTLEGPEGDEETLGVLQSGQFFGEIGLIQDVARTATIRCLTYAQVLRIDEADFKRLLDASPSFAKFLDGLRLKRQLSRIPAFARLGDADIDQVSKLLRPRKVSQGEVLCRQGRLADEIFIVSRGSARIVRREVDGSETPMADKLPGEHYGDEAFFSEKRHIGEMIMQEDGEVLVIERGSLAQLASRIPTIAAELPLRKSLWRSLLPFFYDKTAYLAIPTLSMNRPRLVLWLMLLITGILLVHAVVPSIWPDKFPLYHALKVDTDPENMLAETEPARVLHNRYKQEMNLYDIMVVGVVNETHADGIYNPESLRRIHELADFAATLRWSDDEGQHGVIDVDLMAPSTVDDISQNGPGSISFSWLMPHPPESRDQALAIRDKIKRLPLMDSTLASGDDKAIALYLPLKAKDDSYRVYQSLLEYLDTHPTGEDQFHITGLPVAEDSFGVEMFIQMAISAPAAMLVIFLLLYFFFRNLTLVYAPMIVAMVSVMITMSLLVISGQTVHIMSSMIPIFIMPIAVLDSVHILSEFFDYYPRLRSRRLTMEHVMRELFAPMFYTSITTTIGFASLALVPIPPVQVFGIFVAIGVALAWLVSISFIPAYVFLVRREKIDVIATDRQKEESGLPSMLSCRVIESLQSIREVSLKHCGKISLLSLLLVIGFIYGISRIVVNDNPIRWFHEDHPIYVADQVLNEHFAGTYMAYIGFKGAEITPGTLNEQWLAQVESISTESEMMSELSQPTEANSHGALLKILEDRVESILDRDDLSDDELSKAESLLDWIDEMYQKHQFFKQPQWLNYLDGLQQHLLTTGVVGKTVALTDFVKTVNRELHSADEAYYRIPDSSRAVAQTLLTYQNSHRPQDIWRFVTSDYRQGIIWLLMNSGDNIDMSTVVKAAEDYLQANPPPISVDMEWFGLNYINVVWQQKMVDGMMYSILGSYLAVMLIMLYLLRSIWWAMLAMLPLTVTMLVIYGALGLAGKAYDMPVAVLSALAIGLAIDFAIHFAVRLRHLYSRNNSWHESLRAFYNEPARAIIRNMMVVAIGFTPLLLAPLVPYNTVGYLIATILLVSGIVTLVIIPAIFGLAHPFLFPQHDRRRTTVFGKKEGLMTALMLSAMAMVVMSPQWPLSIENMPIYALIIGLSLFIGIRRGWARDRRAQLMQKKEVN